MESFFLSGLEKSHYSEKSYYITSLQHTWTVLLGLCPAWGWSPLLNHRAPGWQGALGFISLSCPAFEISQTSLGPGRSQPARDQGRSKFNRAWLLQEWTFISIASWSGLRRGQEKMMVRWILALAGRCGSCLERGHLLPVCQDSLPGAWCWSPPSGKTCVSFLPVPILFRKGKAELSGDKVWWKCLSSIIF